MRRLFASIVLLANLVFPLRFGLAELTDFHSPSHGRRVELVKRLKQAGRFSEIYAKKNSAKIAGADKKLIRRPLYTPGTTPHLPDLPSFFFRPCGNAKPSEETSAFYLSTPPHFLRAPPALV